MNGSKEITLADYFAAKAMAVLLAQKPDQHFEFVAKRSYEMARVMLREREKECGE